MFGRNIHLLEPLSCSCSIAGMSQCEKAVSIMCQENFWQVQSGEQRGIGPRITLKFLTHVWVPYISTVAGVMSCSWGAFLSWGRHDCKSSKVIIAYVDVLLFISSQLLVPLYFRRQSNLPVHHRWCKPTPAYIFPAWFNNKLMADIKFFCSTICLCSLIMVSNFDEPKKSWQNAFAFIGRACNLREKFSFFFYLLTSHVNQVLCIQLCITHSPISL